MTTKGLPIHFCQMFGISLLSVVLLGIFLFLLICKTSLNFLDLRPFCWMYVLQKSPSLWVAFCFHMSCPNYPFFLLWLVISVSCLRYLCLLQHHRDTLLGLILKALLLCLSHWELKPIWNCVWQVVEVKINVLPYGYSFDTALFIEKIILSLHCTKMSISGSVSVLSGVQIFQCCGSHSFTWPFLAFAFPL